MKGRWRTIARAARSTGLVVALALGACDRLPRPPPPRPLAPAAQQAIADEIARGFAEVCLTAADAGAATRALQARGWPAFSLVSNQPNSITYEASASTASPAGFSVMGYTREEPASQQLTCVARYPADSLAPMARAIERRWGPSHDGPASLVGSRAWTFRMSDGALTSISSSRVADGPTTAAELAALHPGTALVYAEVYYQLGPDEVSSVMSVWRPVS